MCRDLESSRGKETRVGIRENGAFGNHWVVHTVVHSIISCEQAQTTFQESEDGTTSMLLNNVKSSKNPLHKAVLCRSIFFYMMKHSVRQSEQCPHSFCLREIGMYS